MKFTDIETQKDPMAYLAALRDRAPVYRDPDTGIYLVTRDEDIRRVAMDTVNFSNLIDPGIFRIVMGKAMEQSDPEVAAILKQRGWLLPTTLLLIDPPDHTRYRRLVQEALSPRSVDRLSMRIRERVQALLDEVGPDGCMEFVEGFAKRLPIWIIGRFVFGAPEADFDRINGWSDRFFATLMPAAPREEYLRTVDAMIEMHHYIKGNIDRLRMAPDEDVLLSRLLRIHERTGDAPLTDPELISMMHVMLLAGHDTTRQSLASCAMELARRPDIFDRLRADRDLISPFINEVLRLHPAANVTSRISRNPVDVAGVSIPAGSMVFVAWGSGNRDELVHPDPDRFDLDRNDSRQHLSFGWGLHHCVGAHLARAQLTCALNEIADRYSSVHLDCDSAELNYAPSMNTRSLLKLPLRFERSG